MHPPNRKTGISRRELLFRSGGGIAGLVLCDVLARECLMAAVAPRSPLAPKQAHFPAKARAVVSLFMNGGASHIDTFDPKPELTKRQGEAPSASMNIETFFPYPETFLKSPFTFQRYGESGLAVSELFKHTGECADDIAVIRSMHALSNYHTPAILQMMTGYNGRPFRLTVSGDVIQGVFERLRCEGSCCC